MGKYENLNTTGMSEIKYLEQSRSFRKLCYAVMFVGYVFVVNKNRNRDTKISSLVKMLTSGGLVLYYLFNLNNQKETERFAQQAQLVKLIKLKKDYEIIPQNKNTLIKY